MPLSQKTCLQSQTELDSFQEDLQKWRVHLKVEIHLMKWGQATPLVRSTGQVHLEAARSYFLH